jgi:hypothetical protein
MTADEVVRLIEQAWEGEPYPGDDRLAGKASYCPSEYTYVAGFFRGKHWKDVTLEGLRSGYEGPPDACLAFMSAEAFRFYLPAFMLIAVRDYDRADMAGEAAIAALTPPTFHPELYELAKQPGVTEDMNPCSRANVARQREWWDGRVAGFTARQRQAMIAFLDYMHRTHGAHDVPDLSGPKAALEHWRSLSG